MTATFTKFPKIPRLENLTMVLTEKIDGTNAAVVVAGELGGRGIYAQSRNRFITPDDDNFGFARWVADHSEELIEGLDPGTHFGEWWGLGIQRGYGLKEKRFSLFNVGRWNDETKPDCCHVVPTLYVGQFDPADIAFEGWTLQSLGSEAAPGYMSPEGLMVFIPELGQYVKHPFKPGSKT